MTAIILGFSNKAIAKYQYNPYTTKLDMTGVSTSGDITVTCDNGKILKTTGAGVWACADDAGGGHTIQEEGVGLTSRTNLNFIGTPVTVTDNVGTDSSDVTITEVDGSTTNEIQNLFQTMDTPAGTDPVADTSTDTLQFLVSGIATVTGDSAADTITIGAAEVDPQVGTLTNLKWCSSDGSVVNCSENAPGGAQNIFETVDAPAGTDPVADTTTDTLQLLAGGIVTITGDSAADSVTISATEVDGSTSNELPTAGTAIDVTGQQVDWDSSEVEATTWGAGGNASNVWTFNLSGTDPTITFGNAAVSVSGDLIGTNLSGTNTGDQTSVSGNAGTVTVADAGGDTTTWPLLGVDLTGSLSPRTDAGMTYDATANNLTATTFTGALAGNSTTATALAANGGNCAAGEYPLGVNTLGAVESCTDATTEINSAISTHEGDVTSVHGLNIVNTPAAGDILVRNAGNTAFEDVTMSADASIASTGAVTVANDSHTHGTTTLAGIDIGDDTNLAAGRSLTLSGDSVEADAELFTDTKCIRVESPVATDDMQSIWFAKTATTLTSLWCESDQTVTAMLQVDDGSVADVDSVDMTCDATPPEDTALNGDATLGAGERLDLDIASVSGTPTWFTICWTGTKDD